MSSQQHLADAREVIIAGMLMIEGFTVSKPLSGASRYDLVAERDGKFIKIQVKNLKLDSAYDQSTLPYPVYVLEAYSMNIETKKKQPYSRNEVDVIVGYNHEHQCFAAVPLDKFEGRFSAVLHAKEGLRSEYFNNWRALDEILNE